MSKTNAEWAGVLRMAASGVPLIQLNKADSYREEELKKALRIGADALIGEGSFRDPLREPLRDFALACEATLSTHDLEHGPFGWRFGLSCEGAFARMCDEVVEAKAHLRVAGEDGACATVENNGQRLARLRALQHEVCDVANFAMMIFDIAAGEIKICEKNIAEGVK